MPVFPTMFDPRGLLVFLCLVGCASASTPTTVPVQRALEANAAGAYASEVRLLELALSRLAADEASRRHEVTLRLARAQLCYGARDEDPDAFDKADATLADYRVAIGAAATDRLDARQRRQLARTERDAAIARAEPETWARARCRRFDSDPRPFHRYGWNRRPLRAPR